MKFQIHKSIAFKLAIAFIVSIFIQCVAMSALLLYGGVISQPRENEYKIFSEKVHSRTNDLENEMKNVWTNFEHFTKQITQYFTVQNMQAKIHKRDTNEMLEDLAPILMDALLYTKTTGVFFILNDNADGENIHSALYIRNADPSRNGVDSSNLTLMVGPWNVAQSSKLTTDSNWSINLDIKEDISAFYEKPYELVNSAGDSNLLGYWSAPFSVNSGEDKVITYSIPLKDRYNNPIGVFGVEISLDYLYKFLPSTDLKTQDSYGYIVAMEDGDGKMNPIITRGAMQSRMLELQEPLSLELKNQNNAIYQLNNHKSEEPIFVCMDTLGLYFNNTPFENEKWYLIGMMEKSQLLQFPKKICRILILSVLISLGIALVIAVMISRWFTKPIVNLSKQVNKHTFSAKPMLHKTGLKEIDDLGAAIIHSQNRLVSLSTKLSHIFELTQVPVGAYEINFDSSKVFATDQLPKLFNLSNENLELFEDKEKFKSYLEEVMENAEEEEDVFQLKLENGQRWLRIKQIETEEAVLGVVMDITEDITQTRSLKLERDSDALTGIRNRSAFKRKLSFYNNCLEDIPHIGIGMFDMNGLKKVNDSCGHDKGDEYICESANVICATFPHSPVFRIGGDEFAVILMNMDKEEIERRNEEIKARMNKYSERCQMDIGIAFGYAFYDACLGEKLEEVLSKADVNMYCNKNLWKKTNLEE